MARVIGKSNYCVVLVRNQQANYFTVECSVELSRMASIERREDVGTHCRRGSAIQLHHFQHNLEAPAFRVML